MYIAICVYLQKLKNGKTRQTNLFHKYFSSTLWSVKNSRNIFKYYTFVVWYLFLLVWSKFMDFLSQRKTLSPFFFKGTGTKFYCNRWKWLSAKICCESKFQLLFRSAVDIHFYEGHKRPFWYGKNISGLLWK